MKRSLYLIPTLAIVLAGCDAMQTDSFFEPITTAMVVDNPNATATLEYASAEGTQIRTSGPGINAEGKEIGSCGEGGQWTNPAGRPANAVPHSHCITLGAQQVVSELFIIRHQVSGNNVFLKFGQDADTGDTEIHLNTNTKNLKGEGVLNAGNCTFPLSGVDSSEVEVMPTQFELPGAGDCSDILATLTWELD